MYESKVITTPLKLLCKQSNFEMKFLFKQIKSSNGRLNNCELCSSDILSTRYSFLQGLVSGFLNREL